MPQNITNDDDQEVTSAEPRRERAATSWLVDSPRLGGPVVTKVVPAPADAPEATLAHVVERLATIRDVSPHVVGGVEAGWTTDGDIFVTRPWVDGVGLDTAIASPAVAARLDPWAIEQHLASVIATLHERGIEHGAIRPSNVFVDDRGGTFEVTLTDPALIDPALIDLTGADPHAMRLGAEPCDDIEGAEAIAVALRAAWERSVRPARLVSRVLAVVVAAAVLVGTATGLVLAADGDRAPSQHVGQPTGAAVQAGEPAAGPTGVSAPPSTAPPSPASAPRPRGDIAADLVVGRWTTTVGPRRQRQLIVAMAVVNRSPRPVRVPTNDLRPVVIVGAPVAHTGPPGATVPPVHVLAAAPGVLAPHGAQVTALPMNPDGVSEPYVVDERWHTNAQSFPTRFPEQPLPSGASTGFGIAASGAAPGAVAPGPAEAVFYVPDDAQVLGVGLVDGAARVVDFVSVDSADWTSREVRR